MSTKRNEATYMENQSVVPKFNAMPSQCGLPSSSSKCESPSHDADVPLDWSLWESASDDGDVPFDWSLCEIASDDAEVPLDWSLVFQESKSAPHSLHIEEQRLDDSQIILSNVVYGDPAAGLSHCDQQESVDSTQLDEIDIELEKYMIVMQMLGRSSTIENALREDLDRLVGLYKSFLTNTPQHCNKDCLLGNDARECCWNLKNFQSSPNRKKAFQLDVTKCVTEFLKSKGGRAQKLPLHCLTKLRQWTQQNYENPYMDKSQVQEMTEEIGLPLPQIKYWLDNWRAREWKPITEGHNGRKGKHSHHPKEQTSKLKEWIILKGRYPTKDEAKLLSYQTNIEEEQVITWCSNFRKRNKELFKNWRGTTTSTNRES